MYALAQEQDCSLSNILKNTPDLVFLIKSYSRHFYSENSLSNILGSVHHIYTTFYTTCTETNGTSNKQETKQTWPNLDLLKSYIFAVMKTERQQALYSI